MKNLNRVLYINLQSRPDRKEGFLRELAQWLPESVTVERIEAATPDQINPGHVWYDFKNPITKQNPKAGEIACSMSHVIAWKRVVELNEPCIIFEDDARMLHPDESAILFHHITASLSTDSTESYGPEFVYLGRQALFGQMEYHHGTDFRIPLMSWLSHAYILTPEGATKLLNTPFQTAMFSVDDYLPAMLGVGLNIVNLEYQPFPKLRALAFDKQLFRQQVELSDGVDARLADSDIERSAELFPLNHKNALDFSYCVYTIGSERSKMGVLTKSAEKHQWNYLYNLFGLTMPEWQGGTMQGPGGAQKIIELHHALNTAKHADDDLILFVDAYDVLLYTDTKTFFQRWLDQFDYDKVTFACESLLWPRHDSPATKHLEGYSSVPASGYKFLNSGLFVGRFAAMRKVVKMAFDLVRSPGDDDQAIYQSLFWSNQDKMELDTKRCLFQCINDTFVDQQLFADGNFLVNQTTQRNPLILHGNGGLDAKERFEKIANTHFFFNDPQWVHKNTTLVYGPNA